MRKFKILVSLMLLSGIFSCSNFLNVTPKNVVSMEDMESIKQALSGFLYGVKNGAGYTELPTSPFGYTVGGFLEYTSEWDLSPLAQDEMSDSEVRIADWRNESTQGLWSVYYLPIGFMNLIIHESESAEGEQSVKDYVMGEAYVMRAYCFFKLVQLFAPYHDNGLGIPVCLESYEDFEDVSVKRSTQKEVYARIIGDLKEAEKCLQRTSPRASFNLMYSSSVVNRLLAEVYHFKALSAAAEDDDWENAILYADKETRGVDLTSDPEILKNVFSTDNMTVDTDPECALRIHVLQGRYDFYNMFKNIAPNQTFYQQNFPAEAGDIRRSLYYRVVEDYDSHWNLVEQLKIDKYSTYTTMTGLGYYSYLFCGFRLAEMFLIQAEAYVMTDRLPEAQLMLTRFKQARYTQPFTVPSDKETLLEDIFRERSKEFVAEGDYCWMDMKRTGKKAERKVGGVTYRLDGSQDYRYAFPIPNGELDYNKEIRQNPGWELND